MELAPELARLRQEFQETNDYYVGADYIQALVVHRRHDIAAVEKLLEVPNKLSVPEALSLFLEQVRRYWVAGAVAQSDALQIVGPKTQFEALFMQAGASIGVARRKLRQHPADAITWVDLALGHATTGSTRLARRAMSTAVALAPTNRFVLRSAARMFIHFEEPETAHRLLTDSGQYRFDPWLLAAEHAAAQLAFGKHLHAALGREMVSSENYSPRALSELASELGTDEVDRGRDKRARLFFAKALESPTENAVAQAESVVKRSNIRVGQAQLETDRAFEARSLNFAAAGMWDHATAEAISWFKDQPFAIEPAMFGSFVASLGDDDNELALSIAQAGLRTHPHDALLHNNAAFALAQLNRVAEARVHIASASTATDEVDIAVYSATRGLIEFRDHNFGEGRRLYGEAVEKLQALDRHKTAATASALYALEEIRVGPPDTWWPIVQIAHKNVERFSSPEGVTVVGRMDTAVSSWSLRGEGMRPMP